VPEKTEKPLKSNVAPDLRGTVERAVTRLGIAEVAARLEAHQGTILRVCAGQPIRRGSLALIGQNLEKLGS
jgi:hypothetical protein